MKFWLIMVVIVVALGIGGFYLKETVEKRDAKPTKTVVRQTESKTDSADLAKPPQ